jgi:glycosyltransferase involved in cell wall biosynthesis
LSDRSLGPGPQRISTGSPGRVSPSAARAPVASSAGSAAGHGYDAAVKLSILMPVYNEAATLQSAVKRVLDVKYPVDIELVIVDDGSTDGTRELYPQWRDEPRVLVHEKASNGGKGSAIKKGAELATGDYVIMCDADLEYAPEEIPSLLEPVLDGQAEVVYGTRTFGSHNAYSYLYVLGNRGVTTVANILFNCYISDLETCFKLMPLALYRKLDVKSAGFGMEAEVTGKMLRSGVRPYEVPISYKARSREDGKKLTWKDGVEAIWILTRERFRKSTI